MVDQLFYNKKYNELQIWDWKTNKKIGTKNDYGEKFLEPLNNMDVCELNTYSLQLNLYKHIIEKNTDLKIGKLYICWFHESNKKYEVIECKDFSEEIKQLVKLNKI
jgi:ATP-dependent exoDNAse (exonuclease V) beta subunit